MKRHFVTTSLLAGSWLLLLLIGLPALARVTTAPADFTYDPRVADMIAQVSSTTVYNYDAQLSGETTTLIGGTPYTITTRNTRSGEPIQKATQFVYEHLQQLGLATSYHNWTNGSTSGRNIIGVLTGTVAPNEIVLITAHLDDMPASGRAPGADDNGSGSVGVLLAADILSVHHFQRTVRFVFFTGEEQGLYGSGAYANLVAASGDNIVAVYNMDMIAYDSLGGPTLRLHTRTSSSSGYAGDLAIAGVFTNVVNAYGLSGGLVPIITPDGITASDHSPFWNVGYSAILAIEDDDDDFNAYYHTINDNLSHINLTYFTNFIKASVGTAAHLAKPTVQVGYLRGAVMDANTLQPLGQARISALTGVTSTVSITANNLGQYTLPLPQSIYTVTASAYGYAPLTVNNILITNGLTTTQNFALSPVRSYTVTGEVRDGLTGQALSTMLTIDGYPYGPVTTDENGHYQVTLATGLIYDFHVNAVGYLPLERTVGPLTGDRTEDFTLEADRVACAAPGYTFSGVREAFTSTSTPSGWSVIDHSEGAGWRFDNPKPRLNFTGGTDNFAIADSDYTGAVSMDTELRTPALDFSTSSSVMLFFKTDFRYYSRSQEESADVDVSVKGSAGPWTNVWHKTADYRGPITETLDLSPWAAQQANVMVRFHYYNALDEWWWQLDDVQLGQCRPLGLPHLPILSPTDAMQLANPGERVTYTLQLSNTDAVSHTFDLVLGTHAWPITAPITVGPVSAQSSQPLTIIVTIPAQTLAYSSDVLSLTVQAQDASTLRAMALLTTTVASQHGVRLEPPSATQAGVIGQVLTYTLYLTNTGNLSDTFMLSAQNLNWPLEIMLLSSTLSAGEGVPVQVSMTIPATATLGTSHTVQIMAQGTGTSASSLLTAIYAGYHIWLPLIQKD